MSLVLKETWNICPPLSATSGDVFHQHWAAFLWQNLVLMISSLTAKISGQMSDKCPDIHQMFVFLCSCQRYINTVDSNRLNICGDVRGGFQTGPHSLCWRSDLRLSLRQLTPRLLMNIRLWQGGSTLRPSGETVSWNAIWGRSLRPSLLHLVRGQLNLTFTGTFKGPSFPKPATKNPRSCHSR